MNRQDSVAKSIAAGIDVSFSVNKHSLGQFLTMYDDVLLMKVIDLVVEKEQYEVADFISQIVNNPALRAMYEKSYREMLDR